MYAYVNVNACRVVGEARDESREEWSNVLRVEGGTGGAWTQWRRTKGVPRVDEMRAKERENRLREMSEMGSLRATTARRV